jgi:hypothetical protein
MGNQNESTTLKLAATATVNDMKEYYKEAIETCHFFVAIICDPRYRLAFLEHVYRAEGGRLSGTNAPAYKVAKAHFQHVYNKYKDMAIQIAAIAKQQAEINAAFEATPEPIGPEVRGQEAWRLDPMDG